MQFSKNAFNVPGKFWQNSVLATWVTIACAMAICFGLGSCVQHSSSSIKDNIVLEVVTNYGGQVIPKGDILEIRLFESGRFEYDDYPRCDPNQSYAGEVNIVRRASKIDENILQDLMRLAQQPDFQSAARQYPPPSESGRIDTFSTTTIRFTYAGKDKTISARDLDDIEFIERRRFDYPDSVVKIYEKILELKSEIFARSKAGCKPPTSTR